MCVCVCEYRGGVLWRRVGRLRPGGRLRWHLGADFYAMFTFCSPPIAFAHPFHTTCIHPARPRTRIPVAYHGQVWGKYGSSQYHALPDSRWR